MYRSVKDPRKAGHEVTDEGGNWVAGPWLNPEISQDFAAMLNLGREMRLAEAEQQREPDHG